jgi:cytochrome c peroxidase
MRQLKRSPNAAAIAAVSILALGVGSLALWNPALANGGPSGGLRSLKGINVPLPDLTGIVTDTTAAIALGKALFWDAKAGSDGQACASCHFHAGADSRITNQLDPDIRGVPSDTSFQRTADGAGGPNYTLNSADFPFHQLADVNNRNSAVLFDSNDVVSSAGTYAGTFVSTDRDGSEKCTPRALDTFAIAGTGANAGKTLMTRHVEPRTVPTVVNAVFTDRNFWDGRANNIFNGNSPFGSRDTGASVLVADAAGNLSPQKMALKNASLASQAVGPANSDFEMSCTNRPFQDIGKKLASLPALSTQAVDANDSVLGSLRSASGKGLALTYNDMIKKAFDKKYWSGHDQNGYTQAELNFSMFWGISIMLYEATLVSDDSPFDRYMDAGQKPVPGFGKPEQDGLGVFTSGKGDCATCHEGPTFTAAALAVNGDSPLQRTQMADGGIALTDTGFRNIGVRPTRDDQGLGVTDPFGNPLSYSRQYVASPAGPNLDGKTIDPCTFDARFSPCNVLPGNFGPLTQRVAADGTVKVPGLRNVAQTAPYFHNGGQGTLTQVVQFYSRGGDSRSVSGGDTSGSGLLGESDLLSTPASGSNLADKIKSRNLSASDEAALVAFLKSLTDDRVRCHAAPFDHPELTISNGNDPAAAANGVNAAENTITLAAVGKNGIGAAKCASVANDGDFAQLPATMRALSK